MKNVKAEEFLETTKVVIVVQQLMPLLDAEGGDEAIDRFSHSDSLPLENTEILRGHGGKSTGHIFENRQAEESILCQLKIPIGTKASQDLAKDKTGQPNAAFW
jgi:hypothetical protein